MSNIRRETTYGFKAFVFNGRKTAGKAFDTLEDHMPNYRWIDDAAVVSRNKLGIIRIHSTWAQDDSAVGGGTGFGAVTGGLLGALLGPGGGPAGAAMGGSMGALMGVSSEIAFDDPRLDDFANSLAKDTSALILVGEAVAVARLHLGGRALRGKVIETNLNENDIKALKKALNNKRIGTARREAVEPDSQGGMSGIVAGARRGSDPHVSPGPNISGHAPVAARGG